MNYINIPQALLVNDCFIKIYWSFITIINYILLCFSYQNYVGIIDGLLA